MREEDLGRPNPFIEGDEYYDECEEDEEEQNRSKFDNVDIDDYRDSTINVAELLEAIRDTYGALDDERGCYDYAHDIWLSVYNIVGIIKNVAQRCE